MKNKGFTLIELLATVIILAIVLAIAIPMTLSVIDKVKKRGFIASSITIADDIKKELKKEIINGNITSKGNEQEVFLNDEIRKRLSIADNYQGYVVLSDYNPITAGYTYTIYISDTNAKLSICGKNTEEVTVSDVYNLSSCDLLLAGVQIVTKDNNKVHNKAMVNEYIDLKALFNDSSISNDEKKVKWELIPGDMTVASISDSSSLTPRITFNNYGEVTIKLTSLKTSNENRVNVTVYPEITNLNILKNGDTEINNTEVNAGETINLIANFEPLEANMHDVSWSVTSGSELINITEKDNNVLEVKTLKTGSVTIKAKNDLTGLSKEVTFNIVDKVAPVFSKCEVTNTTITSETITVTVVDEGGSGYYRTLLPDGTYNTSSSFTYDTVLEGKYKFTAYDNAGNNTSCTITTTTTAVNAPELAEGMTPIKWDGSTMVTTTTSDLDWYNYNSISKRWANAQTADGSMWVWIPRYAYQITEGYHSATAGTIEVKFLKDTANTSFDGLDTAEVNQGNNPGSDTMYVTHPAFKFGDDELTGIWVMKFEASSNGGKIASLPNKSAWLNQTSSSMFNLSRSMETSTTYGWDTTGNGIDTHMLKNVEWGAASYLSWSKYGKNSEVWINNSSTYITGCAGTTVDSSSYSGCQFTYNTTNGQNASTTGNYYGIYDMNGGAWDRNAAYLISGGSYVTTYGASLVAANSKYVDKYIGSSATAQTNYNLNTKYYGDAIYETSSKASDTYAWNSDYSAFLSSSAPFNASGGRYISTEYGGVFGFNGTAGTSSANISWRASLIVKEGL